MPWTYVVFCPLNFYHFLVVKVLFLIFCRNYFSFEKGGYKAFLEWRGKAFCTPRKKLTEKTRQREALDIGSFRKHEHLKKIIVQKNSKTLTLYRVPQFRWESQRGMIILSKTNKKGFQIILPNLTNRMTFLRISVFLNLIYRMTILLNDFWSFGKLDCAFSCLFDLNTMRFHRVFLHKYWGKWTHFWAIKKKTNLTKPSLTDNTTRFGAIQKKNLTEP